jgi:hypothetical protein
MSILILCERSAWNRGGGRGWTERQEVVTEQAKPLVAVMVEAMSMGNLAPVPNWIGERRR